MTKFWQMMEAGMPLVKPSEQGLCLFLNGSGENLCGCACGTMKVGWGVLTGQSTLNTVFLGQLSEVKAMHPVYGYNQSLFKIISSLYELEFWSREQIRDWLKENDL